MIQKSRIWSQFESLPPAAQRQVADFIAFLSARWQRQLDQPTDAPRSLRQENFVGVWRDREDMADSTAWVRELRDEEWRIR